MSRIVVHPMPAIPAIVAVAPPPPITTAVRARIEAVWQAERVRRGEHLFNGRLFSVTAITDGRITGTLVDYAWFVAQRRDPALAPVLQVRPLAVGGLLLCRDGIVFGRRGAHVEQDAGLWEPVPSGGIDGHRQEADGRLDVVGQVLTELDEEVGLRADDLRGPPRPFARVDDPATGITILGMRCDTVLAGTAVLDRFAEVGEPEYTELKVVAWAATPAFLAKERGRIAPASAALVTAGLHGNTQAARESP